MSRSSSVFEVGALEWVVVVYHRESAGSVMNLLFLNSNSLVGLDRGLL